MVRGWLKRIVKNSHLTHKEIAEKADINRSYFTQIINGYRRPSAESAKRIALVLNFSDSWYKLLETDYEEEQ